MAVKGNMDIELAVDCHGARRRNTSSESWDIAAFVKTDCR